MGSSALLLLLALIGILSEKDSGNTPWCGSIECSCGEELWEVVVVVIVSAAEDDVWWVMVRSRSDPRWPGMLFPWPIVLDVSDTIGINSGCVIALLFVWRAGVGMGPLLQVSASTLFTLGIAIVVRSQKWAVRLALGRIMCWCERASNVRCAMMFDGFGEGNCLLRSTYVEI